MKNFLFYGENVIDGCEICGKKITWKDAGYLDILSFGFNVCKKCGEMFDDAKILERKQILALLRLERAKGEM